jgi:high-affinity nickel permease
MDVLSQAVLLGAWFGLLHAFDADHLATIGGLALRDKTLPPTGYALRWALGHGVALAVIATLVLGLDFAGVIDWTAYAEFLVCFALLVIGVQALRAVWRSLRNPPQQTASTHDHVLAPAHTHVHFLAPWHSHARSGRTSIAMGLIHGGAGSAAVLALLPLAYFKSAYASAVYLACFSLGVALGAVAFAKVFALAARRSATGGTRVAAAFQAAVGVFALVSGALLFLEIAHGGG